MTASAFNQSGPQGAVGATGVTGATGTVAAPTLPTIASVGTSWSSTGVPTATLPGTHTTNDILLLLIQSANDSNVAVAGYTQIGPQNAVGAASTAGTTKLSVFWKRDGGSESAPTIPDTGDHTFGVMIAVRGCPTTGDPFAIPGQKFKFTASTTGTSPSGPTTIDNCLVMDIFGQAVDAAAAQGSSPTNADLANVTEQFDNGTADGTGGGIYVMTGEKAVAGDVGASTVTWANSTVDVSTRIVWVPSVAVRASSSPWPTQVQTFIGSAADLDDTWVKPTGASRVKVQMMDGGGSGSSGHTVGTPAGGGGGGGGGYSEREFAAADLAATVTVHAGKGGAATSAAVDQAGNIGVVSLFGKGLTPPYLAATVAGIAATAAATGDGGNGGCGSGAGLTSPVAVTTRIDVVAGTPNASSGFTGGPGGSGTTAPVGGSSAVYGGGGGESGGDTDGAITNPNNGYSMYGGGGGGGGRTVQAAGSPGPQGGGAASKTYAAGAAGNDSTMLPFGGSGGCGGDSTTAPGGAGGFPGGGGGGGGGNNAGTQGGRGGHGCVVVTTYF
jgi:hypothetical protein